MEKRLNSVALEFSKMNYKIASEFNYTLFLPQSKDEIVVYSFLLGALGFGASNSSR
jgi:hypothetical protein